MKAQEEHTSHLVDDVIRLEKEKKEIFEAILGRLRDLLSVTYGDKARGVRDAIKVTRALKTKYGV